MKNQNYNRWQNPEKEQKKENAPSSPIDQEMENLIKMKEATKLLKTSPPTVRKYARLGFYREYRFGEKLVFYSKQEILDFILKKGRNEE